MAINKAMRVALKMLSYTEQDLEQSRKMVSIKAIDPLKKFYDTKDYNIENDGHKVLVRMYRPHKKRAEEGAILFFHGGGWVTESVDTYNRVCKNMADKTGYVVAAVDYRLAPEHRFPIPLLDCYAAAREIFLNDKLLGINSDNIVLAGDSAGGNLTAAISLMARDRGEFMPKRQILIYPCTNSDYSDNTKYASVIDNGYDFLLTKKNMYDYVNMYKSKDEDVYNPYFAPILASDLYNQPKTLIVTAEYDPLRDEGEAYGRRLMEYNNDVKMYRIADALHGFFALSTRYRHVKQTFIYINEFLDDKSY